ncbi:response regulator transcription factor [Macellibacteroides fermentans]|uniref:response regulator transcription factor n=1 Tax=Macellibacteroides fermentans TaxID=879969 RepID=UPI002B3CD9A5|nr:response regulator transcription factor [Macellibacteroides fermentans]
MNKILIIEDEQRVADVLRRGLEEMGYLAFVAYDAEMGLRLFRSGQYELVISDIILPKMNGFDLVKEIKEQNKSIPVIMLTALGTTDDKLEGFDAGADDYIVKPFDILELEARIRVLLKRGISDDTKQQVKELIYADLQANLLTKTVYRNKQEIKLTPKEFNLLVYMMQNPDRVLSRTEISEQVWNTHFDTGTNFIDVYINYLRKKIDRNFDTKLIHTKPGMGFILYSGYENQA